MTNTAEFIKHYAVADQGRVAFSWNGKHADEFIDTNQRFRSEVVSECIANPARASLTLLEHLFLAESEWAVEAWGSPHHFAELGSTLLARGEGAALEAFSKGFSASFDTFAACHQMQLAPALLASLTASAKEMANNPRCDAQATASMESALELFEKIANSTATVGWATIAPGTPVSDIQIVWPRWYHKIWRLLSRKSDSAI